MDKDRMAVFEQKMRLLTLEYIASLVEWRIELETLRDQEKWSEDECKKALHILHGIAGSAAIYGFAELGLSAREIEGDLETCEASAHGEIKARLGRFIADCKAAEEAGPSVPTIDSIF